MDQLTPFARDPRSPFDSIRRVRPDGSEYWEARDLQDLLGYINWREFNDAIARAKLAAHNTGYQVSDLFVRAPKKVTGGRPAVDYHLVRFACYLVAMNGDPRKSEIADAQAYFAIKTRESELSPPAPQWQLPKTYAAALELAALQAHELEAARPKAQFVDELVDTTGLYQVAEVAAILKVKGMGRNNLFNFLREHGVLYRANGQNLPKRQHIEAQRFELKAQKYEGSNGHEVATSTPYVTARGLLYIRELLQRNGYQCMGDTV